MLTFEPVTRAAAVMRGFPRPWFIAGGWAIDLFLGRVSRDHEDVDVAVLRRDQEAVRAHFPGWDLAKVVHGRRGPWKTGERLDLPIHEVHAHRTRGRLAALELLLDEAEGDRWIFRRDARITRPLAKAAMRAPPDIPFFAPEIVLLYKAKHTGSKDEADFAAAVPKLDPEGRAWLRQALETAHPGHLWIRRL